MFANDWQKSNQIQECFPPNKSIIAIAKSGKVCWRYNYYKRHGKPWDFKEGGDTDDIRHSTGMFLCPSRESLELTYSGKVAAKYEKKWADD